MSDAFGPLEDHLQYRFRDPSLIRRAITHASARADGLLSNERLGFLGDAVVAMVVSEHLFGLTPQLSEGDMTAFRSGAVSRRTMAKVGRSLGLPEFLQVDQGLKRRGNYPGSIVATAYEAIVGAIFLDGGLEAAAEFVLRTLGPAIERVQAREHELSYKSILQERTQAEGKGTPQYSVVKQEGPDHRRRYLTVVRIGGEECGTGWGLTKKDAEQNAARDALDRLCPGWEDRPPH